MKMQVENGGAASASENLRRAPPVPTINMETLKPVTRKPSRARPSPDCGSQNVYNHYEPTVRLLQISKSASGACGFHLTRSKWDPYPWVSAVDADTPAQLGGLKAGDCVLEVNGEDVLGLRITDIAKLVKSESEHVTLLLWNTGWDAKCDPESLCCAPMPSSLRRLSFIVQSILSIIECPVCLDTIPPPVLQCQNGHLLCLNCRIRSVNCPVCRDRYTPRRALIAEQIYTTITNAFNLCSNEDKLRQKLFGPNAKHPNPGIEIPTDTKEKKPTKVHKSRAMRAAAGDVGATLPANKFLTKWLRGQASSMENLSNCNPTTTHATAASTSALLAESGSTLAFAPMVPVHTTMLADSQLQSCSNQFQYMTHAKNHLTAGEIRAAPTTSPATAITVPQISPNTSPTLPMSPITNGVLPTVNTSYKSKHFSLSTNDLSLQQHEQEQQKIPLDTSDGSLIAVEGSLSLQRLSSNSSTTADAATEGKSMTSPTSSLLFLDKRRPCTSLSTSIECIRKGSQMPDDDNSKAIIQQHTNHSPPPPYATSSSSASSSSSGIFTALDTSSACSATMKDELLSLSPTLRAAALSSSSEEEEAVPTSAISSLQSSSSSASVELSSAPAGASTSPDMTLQPAANSSPPSSPKSPALSSSSVEHSQQHQQQHLSLSHKNRGRYRCPCNCGKSFNASSQLQRHVKVVHRLPILSLGGASVQLALPLRQPIDDAILILEINNDSSQAYQAASAQGADHYDEDDADESVENDDKATGNERNTKECWIRLKTMGRECIQTSALLQASTDESANFVLETRLSDNRDEDHHDQRAEMAGHTAARDDVMQQETNTDKKQVTRTRSIVQSMETTSWQATFNQHHYNSVNTNNSNSSGDKNDFKYGHRCDTNDGSTSNSSSNSSSRGCGRSGQDADLNVISVIYHQHQQQQQHERCDSNSNGGNVGDLLLNIDVRRIN